MLARRKIPYRLVGGIRFWERREVKDLVAYLRFCFNPQDALSFARIVSVPSRKIGNVTIEAINSYAREGQSDILAILTDPARVPGVPKTAVGPLHGFRAQIESVRSTMGVLRPSELVDQVVEVMGLRAHYLDGTPQGEARLENMSADSMPVAVGFHPYFQLTDSPREAGVPEGLGSAGSIISIPAEMPCLGA